MTVEGGLPRGQFDGTAARERGGRNAEWNKDAGLGRARRELGLKYVQPARGRRE